MRLINLTSPILREQQRRHLLQQRHVDLQRIRKRLPVTPRNWVGGLLWPQKRTLGDQVVTVTRVVNTWSDGAASGGSSSGFVAANWIGFFVPEPAYPACNFGQFRAGPYIHYSNWLQCAFTPFAIPAHATIKNITAAIQRAYGTHGVASIYDVGCDLLLPGGGTLSPSGGFTAGAEIDGGIINPTYSVSGITPAIVNGSGFGLRYAAQGVNTATSTFPMSTIKLWDGTNKKVSLTISYTLPDW